MRKGDTLVVWRLDRLGRSLRHLIDVIADLEEARYWISQSHEIIDTTTSGGRLIFQIFGALAEFERNLIKERTQAGLKAARVRGRLGGRPKALDAKKLSWPTNSMTKKSIPLRKFARCWEFQNHLFMHILNKEQVSVIK